MSDQPDDKTRVPGWNHMPDVPIEASPFFNSVVIYFVVALIPA